MRTKLKPSNTGTLTKLLSATALMLVLNACAPTYQGPRAPVILMPTPPDGAPPSYPQSGTYPRPEAADKPAPTAIEPITTRPQVAPDAVATLLHSAWDAHNNDQYDTAIAFAERAQRIDSRHPEVYLVLGSSYFAKQQYTLAQQMALKGIAFSSTGTSIRYALEMLRDRASTP